VIMIPTPTRLSSAGSFLLPSLLTCLDDFVQVRGRPYLDRSKPILKEALRPAEWRD
jgi:hypothetical protein